MSPLSRHGSAELGPDRRQQPRPRAAEIVLALWQAPAGARKLNRLLPLLTDEMTIGEHDRPARRATVTSPGSLLGFRDRAGALIAARGWRITAARAASNLTLWLVLLACLRGSGLSQA